MSLLTGALRLKIMLVASAVGLTLLLIFGLVMGAGVVAGVAGGGIQASGCGAPTVGGSGQIGWPLKTYTISSPFGPRAGGFHYGVDLAAPLNTPIYAVADGTIVKAGAASGFGDWIVEDSTINGAKVSFVYGHEYPSGLLAQEGQQVKTGDMIGLVGENGEATGPHVHFEVWPGGRLTGGKAVDPMSWLNGSASAVAPSTGTAKQTPPSVAASPSGTGGLTGAGVQGPQATMTIDGTQQANVAKIVATTKGQGLPLRAAVIAVATAMQESSLRNLNYGDRDSLGMYQQRTPWGPAASREDPVQSTVYFLKGGAGGQPGLVAYDWQHLLLSVAAQDVQVSAYPSAYAKWEQQAMALVAQAAGVDPITAGLGSSCGLT